MRTPEKAWAVAHKLLHKAAMRLRAGGLWASSIGLAIGFAVPRGEKQPVSNFGVPTRGWKSELRAERVPGQPDADCRAEPSMGIPPAGQDFEQPYFIGVHLNGLVPDRLHSLNLFEGPKTSRAARACWPPWTR